MAEQQREFTRSPGRENIRTGLSVEAIRLAFLDNLFYVQGRFLEVASTDNQYRALAYTIRDRLLHRWVSTVQTCQRINPRTVSPPNACPAVPRRNLLNLGIEKPARRWPGLDSTSNPDCPEGRGWATTTWTTRRLLHGFACDLQIAAVGWHRYEFGISPS